MVVLWVSHPELFGVGSLQPALPSSAACLLQSCQPWSRYPAQLLSASLEWSESGLAPVCHHITSALVPAVVGQEHIISVCSMFQGLLPPAHRQAWLLGVLLLPVCSFLCFSSCCAGDTAPGEWRDKGWEPWPGP